MPSALGLWAYISGKSLMAMLTTITYLCITQTPVHCACELVSETNLSKEILKLLLRHGGDLYQRDHAGVTPLQSINSSLYTTVVQDICSKHLIIT